MTIILSTFWIIVCVGTLFISNGLPDLAVSTVDILSVIFLVIATTMIIKKNKEKILPINLAIISIITAIILHIKTKVGLFDLKQLRLTGILFGLLIVYVIIEIFSNIRKKSN
jgi:hypothetical protein